MYIYIYIYTHTHTYIYTSSHIGNSRAVELRQRSCVSQQGRWQTDTYAWPRRGGIYIYTYVCVRACVYMCSAARLLANCQRRLCLAYTCKGSVLQCVAVCCSVLLQHTYCCCNTQALAHVSSLEGVCMCVCVCVCGCILL